MDFLNIFLVVLSFITILIIGIFLYSSIFKKLKDSLLFFDSQKIPVLILSLVGLIIIFEILDSSISSLNNFYFIPRGFLSFASSGTSLAISILGTLLSGTYYILVFWIAISVIKLSNK